MRGFAVAVLLSLFLIPAGAFAKGKVRVVSHKGKTTIHVRPNGKPAKVKIKS
jgi:hypothetical protein